jgi:transposase InsO family protein
MGLLANRPVFGRCAGQQLIQRSLSLFHLGLTDIKTRVAHPQSNGRLERLHRTHREEGLSEEELTTYHQALDVMARWSDYYNHRRPHSALKYLCPVDYYRGDPEARLAERECKMAQAVMARATYWQGECVVKERELSHT